MKIIKKKLPNKNDLISLIGNQIYTGPFSGLKIPEIVQNILTTSEILGLYESCLHPNIETLISKEVKTVVMVGGNNGYYSAGLSYILAPEMIYIYESLTHLHPVIESWYTKNELKNYSIRGEATLENFSAFKEVDFLFMDCEGFEVNLLDPELYPWQKNCNILFEMHQFFIDKLLSKISERFRNSHSIEIIYDDFNEDTKVDKLLHGFKLDINYNRHPTHRWIMKEGKKVFTSGMFMSLTKK